MTKGGSIGQREEWREEGRRVVGRKGWRKGGRKGLRGYKWMAEGMEEVKEEGGE